MKKSVMLLAIIFTISMTLMVQAFAQEGAAMDARNDAQDQATEQLRADMLVGKAAIMADLFELELRIKALEEAEPVDPPQPIDGVMLQGGPWFPNTSNIEEPFINLIHAGPVSWTETSDINTQELFDIGLLDDVTGLPKRRRDGLRTGVYFATWPDKTHWAGDWVLEWEGDVDLWPIWGVSNSDIVRVSPNRLEWPRGVTNDHTAISVRSMNGPLKSIRLYRKENESALKAGKIYNPRFIDEVRKHHVVRSMDLQEANRAAIRDFDDIATLDACCWNNFEWQTGHRFPFSSAPLDAVIALAIEADNSLWHHAPITLGAPAALDDIDLGTVDNPGERNNQLYQIALGQGRAQFAQGEWDEYARGFVEALDRRGYKATTALYTTLSNEVWNYSWQYQLTTIWASGVGAAFNQNYRFGYGMLLARYALAMERALEDAGRDQRIVYVLEGQAANPSTTRDALAGAKAFIEARGENWDEWAPKFGVSVASYWGGMPNWRSAGTVDEWRNPTPDFWRRVEDQILNGPADEIATKAWVLARFAEHEAEGAHYGVRLIGAYEGGSHLEKPHEMPSDAYEAWHWGEAGGRVNAAVNQAIADAYPDIILSNYVLAGPKGGQPWFEGPIGDENNTMIDSWSQFQKQQ